MLLLAQLSDLHLNGTERSVQRVTTVMDHLRSLPRPVDAVLVTGDIADHGAEDEYETAAQLLTGPFPVLTCPGNHDVRAAYRKTLLHEPATDEPVNRLYHVNGTAILMCDSTIPDSDNGELAAETLRFIVDSLDMLAADTPALIAFHHPPVALHHPLPDDSRLLNSSALADLIADRPQVAALIVGHAHTGAASTFAGRPLLAGPGITWTLRMPWEGSDIIDRAAPPGLAYHVLDDERRITTHYRVAL